MFKNFLNKILSRSGFVDPLSLAAVALGVICVTFLCANFVVVNNDTFDDFSDMGDAYVEWARENRPDILNQLASDMEDYSYDYRGLNPHWAENLYSGPVIGVLCDVSTYKDIIQSIYDFLSSVGSFSSNGDLTIQYDSSSSGVIGEAQLYELADRLYFNYYGYECNDKARYHSLVLSTARNYPYITWCSNLRGLESDTFGFGAVFCSGQYMNVTDYGAWWSLGNNGTTMKFFYPFGYSDYRYVHKDYVILSQVYFDSTVVDTPATDKTYTATDSGREFADNPQNFADTSAERVAQDVITHYGDGRTDVKQKVTFAFPITGTYPTDFSIDDDSARDIPYSDSLTDSPTDYYTEDSPADTVDNTSVWSRVIAFINGYWDSFFNGILRALRNFFLPNQEFTERMIADIRQAFIDKFSYTDFDFDSLFAEAFEPQDFYLTDYSAGGLSSVTAKIVDVSFLKTAALKFRSLIRAIISLMLLLYNLNQLMHFIGQAGVSLGFWEPGEDDSLPVDIRGFLARGGHFRRD